MAQPEIGIEIYISRLARDSDDAKLALPRGYGIHGRRRGPRQVFTRSSAAAYVRHSIGKLLVVTSAQ